ncbi:MAG TPA: TM0106 family RecB-like putative nuclease [Planctomycetota bacterium]|nr:TM0106 family RecB-like putative nuclease [Planctomycetota bacterium]
MPPEPCGKESMRQTVDMPRGEGRTLSPTDVAHHLAWAHRTQLERQVRENTLKVAFAPDARLQAMRIRGAEHERAYVERLRSRGLQIADLATTRDPAATLDAMRTGTAAIVQAPLGNDTFFGIADVLLRTDTPSALGDYSYEPVDTKLAAETKAGALLQLLTYCELLGELQGVVPARFHVVTPVQEETYRTADYAAYFRVIRDHLRAAHRTTPPPATYPAPVPHCDICSYWKKCENDRRSDDHPSLIADIQRGHVRELQRQGLPTLEAFAKAGKLTAAPERGRPETYDRLAHQARLQLAARGQHDAPVERLPIEPGRGLCRLPTPCAGDVFLDFEGDPFVGRGGLEYLTGYCCAGPDGEQRYERIWSLDHASEKLALETFLDVLAARLQQHPDLHVYHFGAYEVAALRRLCARHDTRGATLDEFLRGERFVNLHTVVREALRIGIEGYGLKELEKVIGFSRQLDLRTAGEARRDLELDLELGRRAQITLELQQLVADYNREDCLATVQLRQWLEQQRRAAEQDGTPLERPALRATEAQEEVRAREQRVADLRQALAPLHPLLADLVGYFRREAKSAWWEHFRLRDLPRDEHLDEREMLAGLSHVRTIPKQGRQQRDRDVFRFPPQECAVDDDDTLVFTVHEDPVADPIGSKVSIDSIDVGAGEITVLLPEDAPDSRPTALFRKPFIAPTNVEDALLALGDLVRHHGLEAAGHGPALDLLLRRPPRTTTGRAMQLPGESPVDSLIRVCRALDGGVLPVQGPPGAGKTYAGARAIVALAETGKRVGVIAVGHKVIDNLLAEVVKARGSKDGAAVWHVDRKPGHKDVPRAKTDKAAIEALDQRAVVGGTAFFWAKLTPAQQLDYLFVDEAGQMSLAQVLAIARAAKNLVLLGDPQQLEQPHKGAHPDGADVAALTHLIGADRATLTAEQGLFLPTTRRLHPSLCTFTSELYYDRRLGPMAGCELQRIDGTGVLDGAGLFMLECPHEGNQASSKEEVDAVVALVQRILQPAATWTNREGRVRQLTAGDVLVIAPYNAQVGALRRALAGEGVAHVGTVDKFQGQEAPVVIYSCTSSSPDDAPRGLAFLYDPHRLNVASSRAPCAFVMVASPALFVPEVKTPEQMRWANGMCRFREVARSVLGVAR